MAAPSRWASQAALDTLLRFNPQKQALAEQIREAQGTYNTAVRAGRLSARETERGVQRALPQLAQAYAGADLATKPTATLVSQALAALPPDAAQYRANQAANAGTYLANLAGARADAQRLMLERSTRAREGAQSGQAVAAGNLASTLQQIFGKQRALAGEAGAFGQSEQEKLQAEAEGRRVTERGQNLTAASAAAGRATTERGQNITAATAAAGRAQKAAEGKKGKGKETAPGVKEATPDQYNSAKAEIEKMRHEAFHVLRSTRNLNYEQASEALQQPVKTKVFTRQPYANSGKLRAALDLAYFGGVGGGAASQLHNEGYGLGRLGYPLYRPPSVSGADVRKALVEGFRAGGIR